MAITPARAPTVITGINSPSGAALTAAGTVGAGETCEIEIAQSWDTSTGTQLVPLTFTGGGSFTLVASADKVTGTAHHRVEKWRTSAGGATAASTVGINTYTGSPDSLVITVRCWAGVAAIGISATNTGTGSNPFIDLTTQDTNNFVSTAWVSDDGTVLFSAFAGTTFRSEGHTIGNTDAEAASTDNTNAAATSVRNQVTHTGGDWAAVALELRSTGGGGGGTVTPRRGCLTMIADRMAKTIMIGMAVHTVVGRHELRGAAQRTKVALPVVKTVRITPPKVTQDILPYPWKGAAVKKPRPFPELFLTRKPLPVTKSVVLPHMLKGAPQRKPVLVPEVVSTRTPFPIARPLVGKHIFVAAPAAVRIIVDPTTMTIRTPLPRTQSWVGRFVARVRTIIDPTVTAVRTPLPATRTIVSRAAIQHPTTGSAAPILSMIEMDLPVVRSAIPRRTVLQPPPPAPSRARPVLALTRTPRPVVDTTVGIPRPRLSTPAKSTARPMLSLVRSLRPVAESFVLIARRVAAPVICRARPLFFRARTAAPHAQTTAGSGIARGTAVHLQLAIARSDAVDPLLLGTSATTAIVQNSATTRLGTSNSATTALAWQNSAITPLDTSE